MNSEKSIAFKHVKEAYFTPETRNSAAADLLAEIGESSRRRRHTFQLGSAVLLVLDMQRVFLEPDARAFIPSAPAIVPAINRLIEIFHGSSRPVIITRHSNQPGNAGSMARWWRVLMDPDDPYTAIADSINKRNCLLLEKHQYDCFYQTNLEEILRVRDVDSVVITGVMTHICCASTARAAFHRGFNVYFPADTTATYTRNFHTSALTMLSHCCAVVSMSRSLPGLEQEYEES